MDRNDWLAERLEAQRTRMRALAYRMLASLSEADDAVQEASLHISWSGGLDTIGMESSTEHFFHKLVGYFALECGRTSEERLRTHGCVLLCVA